MAMTGIAITFVLRSGAHERAKGTVESLQANPNLVLPDWVGLTSQRLGRALALAGLRRNPEKESNS